jgi:thiol-disulfide isomerase/thioredoxin
MRRLIVVVSALAATACTGANATDQVRTLDQPLPAFSGTDLTGRRLDVADFAGSVLVINAWASWCGPCERETPMLASLAERYRDRGVRFLGIDHADQLAEARRFVERYDVPYPSLADQAGRFAAILGYPGLPATFVVDAEGTMRYAVFLEIDETTLVRLLEDVLASEARTAPA